MVKRFGYWFIHNLIFSILIYFGLFKEVVGAQNIIIFYCWILFILSLLIALTYDKVIEKLSKNNKESSPKWFRILINIFNVVVVLIFCWYSWYFMTAIYFISFLITSSVKESIIQKRRKDEESTI